MNQDFKLKFDEYKDNDPTEKTGGDNNPDYYPSFGNVRNLAVLLPDGKMQFFNYSYLVTCSYSPEQNSIKMEFSTHSLELKGQRLEQLFYELMAQVNKVIRCSESRYSALDTSADKPVVSEIIITEK